MKRKIAFIFPGQGSQCIGMGEDFYNEYPVAKEIYEKANLILNKKITDICFKGPEDVLKQTINTQPAIVTTSIAILEAFKEKTGINPDFVAGHSLGEYCALSEAGALSLENTLKLIQKRANAMNKSKGGSMAACLALSDEKVKEVLAEVKSGYVDVANFNCPGQVVITGEEAAIEEAIELLKNAGAKRVLPLAVSGAFHSKKMTAASDEFKEYLADITVEDAKIPVVTNVDGNSTVSGLELKEKMPRQICSSVYWTKSVENMISAGVDTFIEIGPGKVLSGLIKKINSDVNIYNISDKESLEACVEILKNDKKG